MVKVLYKQTSPTVLMRQDMAPETLFLVPTEVDTGEIVIIL